MKDFFKITFKCLLVLVMFVGMFYYLTPYFRKDRSKDGDYFRNLPKDSIDVIALGSSHMQYAFNPGIFYEGSGYYSYVMGSPCQPFPMSYSMLKEVLKTQSPEVAVVDVFTLLPQSEVCFADGMFYKAIDRMEGETRLEAADHIPEKNFKMHYKYDLIMNHSNWKTMDLNHFDEVIENGKKAEGLDPEMGYVRSLPERPDYSPLITYETSEKISLQDFEKQQIDDLIELCKEHNIHLIFVKTPYIIDQDNTNKLHAIWSYLDSKQVPYIDFIEKSQELHWFLNMDGDTWHNNVWGSEIISNYLAKFVKKNKLVSRHQENKVIDSLISEMNENNAYCLLNDMNHNIYRILEDASIYPCTVLVKYKGFKTTSIGEYENELLQNLGLKHDFIENCDLNYYAIVQNGKLLKESNETLIAKLNGVTYTIDDANIKRNGDVISQDGEMELVIMANDGSWFTPIGIDYHSRWFWQNGYDGFTPIE